MLWKLFYGTFVCFYFCSKWVRKGWACAPQMSRLDSSSGSAGLLPSQCSGSAPGCCFGNLKVLGLLYSKPMFQPSGLSPWLSCASCIAGELVLLPTSPATGLGLSGCFSGLSPLWKVLFQQWTGNPRWGGMGDVSFFFFWVFLNLFIYSYF